MNADQIKNLTKEQLLALLPQLTAKAERDINISKARTSLEAFAKIVHPTFESPPHIMKIIEVLEAVERGEMRRVIFNMSPRNGKSLCASNLFPAWYLGRDPTRFIIASAYSYELAIDFGKAVMKYMTDDDYLEIFPRSKISPHSRAAKAFDTVEGGKYVAVGMGGSATGRGANLFLIDDPYKNAEAADSAVQKKNVIDWYQQVVTGRLQSTGAQKDAIVLTMTRWREDDLVGWVLENSAHEDWKVFSFPAIAEEHDILGRSPGDPLWPSRFPLEKLAEIKQTVGPRTWNSQYQQHPTAVEGNLIKRNWWRKWQQKDLPDLEYKVIGVDTAYSDKSDSDFSAICVVGVFKDVNNIPNAILLSTYNKQCNFHKLAEDCNRIYMENQGDHPTMLVEHKGAGIVITQELQRLGIPVVAVKVDTDKKARVNAISPLFETHHVFYIDNYENRECVEQFASFPHGKHDDMVDAMSLCLLRIRKMNLVTPVFDDDVDEDFEPDRPFVPRSGSNRPFKARSYWR